MLFTLVALFASYSANPHELVGAFAYRAASKDAAVLANLSPGSYSVQVAAAGPSSAGGETLVVVYELPQIRFPFRSSSRLHA